MTKRVIQIINLIIVIGLISSLLACVIYWSAAAFEVGHFPTYKSNLKWRPFPKIRPAVDFLTIVMVFCYLAIIPSWLISLIKKSWRISKKQFLVGMIAIILVLAFFQTDFLNWFWD